MNQPEWQEAFKSLQQPLEKAGLSADVFIWDEFHDRFLVTNLIGILMANGFDVSGNANDTVVWSRMDRNTREKIQREFDYPNNAGFHELRGKFAVGKPGG